MQFNNGHWGEYARGKGKTIWGTARKLQVSRQGLYLFLQGNTSRLGKSKKAALAKLWRISLPGLLKKIEQAKAAKGKGATE